MLYIILFCFVLFWISYIRYILLSWLRGGILPLIKYLLFAGHCAACIKVLIFTSLKIQYKYSVRVFSHRCLRHLGKGVGRNLQEDEGSKQELVRVLNEYRADA